MTSSAKKLDYTSRSALVERAIRASSQLRQSHGLDQHSPICVYDLCQRIGVSVRFNDFDMEGMYQRAEKPVIHLSAKRPLVRRVFNCAHELGHHVFGHGSSIDALNQLAHLQSWENPEELLADAFAAHLLMPAIGIRGAFNRRNIAPRDLTPSQVYTVACEFGVGYQTLLTQLSVGLQLISTGKCEVLRKSSPKQIRKEVLGTHQSWHLMIAGPSGRSSVVDLEVGSHLLVPRNAFSTPEKLVPVGRTKHGNLYVACHTGITMITAKGWSTKVRIAPKSFVGLAKYRHLEEAA